eukprot:3740746-Alexandrium_andersonii.AAC.1
MTHKCSLALPNLRKVSVRGLDTFGRRLGWAKPGSGSCVPAVRSYVGSAVVSAGTAAMMHAVAFPALASVASLVHGCGTTRGHKSK